MWARSGVRLLSRRTGARLHWSGSPEPLHPERFGVRSRVINFLKIPVSFALIIWAFSRVDLPRVAVELSSARLGFFVLALLLYLLAIVTNAVKWQVLLRAQGVRVPWTAATNFQFIGFFFNRSSTGTV
jgi:uncharacterized membrane protein YbhN (UPF0104 family)